MANGEHLFLNYRGNEDNITNKASNGSYISAMEARYGTENAKDNSFKGQVQEVVEKTAPKH